MDIVERLRMKGPMSFQMDWSDRANAADEIERLREEVEHLHKMTVKWSVLQVEGSQEIQRLREDRAELLEALKFYACDCQCLDGCSIADCGDVARKAIAKATGAE